MILESSTLLKETLAYGAMSWTIISITRWDFFPSLKLYLTTLLTMVSFTIGSANKTNTLQTFVL